MKYGTWVIGTPKPQAVEALCASGYGPLTARVLSSRGIETAAQARALLDASAPLTDPFQMKGIAQAVTVIRQAIQAGTKIAVFGDYDVDGITATCLLADYLRSEGANCLTHIPGRLEEGYGLNPWAIRRLADEGVGLIVTVDCGITALEEARLCAQLGIALVITDHHECKEQLPEAAAVIDPHRADRTYPHTNLSGVGIAFKLAAALSGNQAETEERYCDLFCLGTIADVMPLCGENRRLVQKGLAALQQPKRLGLRALIHACGCDEQPVTASTVGYVLAPRINAAGRMEHAELAVRLFLATDEDQARELSETLCRLNRERQEIELEIYREAVACFRRDFSRDSAIVLAGEHWHQGVVGIVASRLSEEFCRPTFLICLNGEHGKASSRSYGGFNLFAALTELSQELEGYGGHEQAAGFTIARDRIDSFRKSICSCVDRFVASGQCQSALKVDCEISADLLTEKNVRRLSELEPCGTGCCKPLFSISEATLERISAVGNGKHLRLKLHTRTGQSLNAIYFSAGGLLKQLKPGDRIDLAFQPQINEFRGQRSVQLCVVALRPVEPAELLDRFLANEPLTAAERAMITPERSDVAAVWHYLTGTLPRGRTAEYELAELCRAIAAASAPSYYIRRTASCLYILQELGFLTYSRNRTLLAVQLFETYVPNRLENSRLLQQLRGE